jgi:hypothetical protein
MELNGDMGDDVGDVKIVVIDSKLRGIRGFAIQFFIMSWKAKKSTQKQ